MMGNVRTTGSRLLGLVMAALIAIAMAAAVAALPAKAYADEAAVRDVANGVLKLNWHVDGEDYSRGSCFLINDQTVITAYHCTFFSKNELEANEELITKNFGSVQDLRDHMTYSVSINRDVKVGATLVNYSEEQDFAILKLDQPLNGYKALKFRDSSTVEAAETVFSVGFPANSDLKAIASFTADDATFKRGTVSKPEGLYQGTMDFWFEVNGYFLQTDCPISGGDSGGPMVDESGNVVGISVMGNESFYFCVASDVVTPVLKTLGIEYQETGATSAPKGGSAASTSSASSPSTETYALSFTDLDAAISKAKDYSADAYTPESYKKLTDALAAAEEAKKLELADNTDKAAYDEAQQKIKDAAGAIDAAISGLEKKPEGLPMAAIVGIAIAVVALIAVVVAVMASRKKKGTQPAASAAQAPVTGSAPAAPAAAQPALQSGAQTWQKPATEGAAETTILEDEATDTVILFQAASGGSLTRMSTNEQIPINSAEFTIGRERSKVNYCLEGNSSISRIHVRIVVRDGKVYLVDNKAANGTYVNGVKCRPGEEVLLKGGDIITLADEKFKYNS